MLCAMSKLRVGLLFGGRSTEHEVSVVSATTIAQALDPARYVPVLIGIDHDGGWHVAEPDLELLPGAVIEHPRARRAYPQLRTGLELVDASGRSALAASLDAVFPIVHGRGGEDGSLQGLLEMAGVPYVGAGVLATALCMDKAQTKAVLSNAGLPVVPCLAAASAEVRRDPQPFAERVEREFGFPLFAKPVNTGSSVGVSKAHTRAQLHLALKEAARYDADVLVEPGIQAREIECAVLGGRDPQGSVLGEITYPGEFYDYEAKYVSDQTQLIIPADLPPRLGEELRSCAVAAFRATGCWGMARVDFFVRPDGSYLVNELNTLPGFTDGSMYPRLWDASGIALPELVDRLIELALERHREAAQVEIRFRR
jgi:D-alanine-D-alanine ligase